MQLEIQEAIERARVYVGDDHDDQGGWLRPARWLSIFKTELATQYKQWVRMGLVSPEPVDVEFTGPSVAIPVAEDDGLLSIVGVVEDCGGQYREIREAQPTDGRSPFRTPEDRSAECWEARGEGDRATIYLHPEDTTGSYIVRYIPLPTVSATVSGDTVTGTVTVPDGADERIILGMARRAGLKDMASSALLERLIREADIELNFMARGRLNSAAPRVRRTGRGTPYPGRYLGIPRYR